MVIFTGGAPPKIRQTLSHILVADVNLDCNKAGSSLDAMRFAIDESLRVKV